MLRQISSVLMLRVVGIAFQLGWFMLLVRLLPIEQVGIYSAINSLWLLMRALGPMGSDQALMRRLPTLLESGEQEKAHGILQHALTYLLKWQGLLMLLLLGAGLIAQSLGMLPLPPEILVLIAAVSMLYGINGQQVYVMLATKRPLLANAFEGIWLPLALAGGAALLHLQEMLSLESLLIWQALAMLGFCLFGLWLTHVRLMPHQTIKNAALSQQDCTLFALQSRQLLATSAAIHLTMRLPVIAAPFLIGAAQTALLETAMRFATLLGLVAFAAAQVTLPSISAYAEQQKRTELQALLHQASWLIFLPTLGLFGGLALFGEPLISLIAGEEYRAAYAPLMVLSAAYLLAAAAGPMQHLFTMSGLAGIVTKVSLLELLVSVILMLLLAPWLGALGLAAAISFGMALRNGLFHALLPARLQLHAGVLSRSGLLWALKRLRP